MLLCKVSHEIDIILFTSITRHGVALWRSILQCSDMFYFVVDLDFSGIFKFYFGFFL